MEYASDAPKVTTLYNLNGSYSSNTWSATNIDSTTTSNTQGVGISNDGGTLFYAPPLQQNLYKITAGNGNYFFGPTNNISSSSQSSYRLFCQCVSDNGYAVFSPYYGAATNQLYVYTISGGVLTYSSTLSTVYPYPIAKCIGNTLIVSSSNTTRNVDISQYTYSGGSFGSHLTIAAYFSAQSTGYVQNSGIDLVPMDGGKILLCFTLYDFNFTPHVFYLFGYVYNGSSWVVVTGSHVTHSTDSSTSSAIYESNSGNEANDLCLAIYHSSTGLTQGAYVNQATLVTSYYNISGSGSSWSASSSPTGTITQSSNTPSSAYGSWTGINAIYDGTDVTYPYLHFVSPLGNGGGTGYGGAMRSYSWNGSSWASSLDWQINSINGGLCQNNDNFGYIEAGYDSNHNSMCVYNNKFAISSATGVIQQYSFVKSASGMKVTFDAPEILANGNRSNFDNIGLAMSPNGLNMAGGLYLTGGVTKVFGIQRSSATSSSTSVGTGQTFGTIGGKISQGVSGTYVYASDFTNGTIYRIRISDGNLTQIYNTSVVTSANDTSIWVDPSSGDEFLFFNYYTGSVYSVGYLDLTTWNGSALSSVSQCTFTGSSLPTFDTRKFYISTNATSEGYNLLFIGYSTSSTTIYQTSLSVSGGVPQLNYNGTANYTIPSETKILNSLTSTNQGGYNDGNLRLFTINSDGTTNTMHKIYNASGTGITNLTSGVGGDLHCKALNGKSVIVIREEKLELLNTHPRNYTPLHSNEVKTRIDVDGFSLKNDYDNFAKDRMSQEQIDLAITNLDDSYFKRVYITLSGGNIIGERKYVIDGLTFLIEGENDDGKERKDEYIHFSDYKKYSPGEAPSDIKTKFIIPHVVGRRKFIISTGEYTIECDLCRENKIHVNDLSLSFSGERDPTSFSGLSITGEVYSPVE